MRLYSYFRWCGYFWGPCVSFATTNKCSVRATKITSRIGVSWIHRLPFYVYPIMAILSKAYKPDNFELRNSLELSFMNIWGLHLSFVDCESFLESNSPDTLALCQINPDDSIDPGNFLVIGYLPLIRNDSSTHMHGLAVNLKEGLPFARELSLENSADSYLCFRLALLDSVSYFFCSINHLLCLCAWLLILFHLT